MSEQLTQTELEEWVRAQFQVANKHLAENGILFDSVVLEDSRYLAPKVAVWKILTQDKEACWVICGDVPVAFVPEDVANDARTVLRHFSLTWQLKAEKLQHNEADVNAALHYTQSAETIYQFAEDDALWQ